MVVSRFRSLIACVVVLAFVFITAFTAPSPSPDRVQQPPAYFVEDFDYWLPMFYNTMTTLEIVSRRRFEFPEVSGAFGCLNAERHGRTDYQLDRQVQQLEQSMEFVQRPNVH